MYRKAGPPNAAGLPYAIVRFGTHVALSFADADADALVVFPARRPAGAAAIVALLGLVDGVLSLAGVDASKLLPEHSASPGMRSPLPTSPCCAYPRRCDEEGVHEARVVLAAHPAQELGLQQVQRRV